MSENIHSVQADQRIQVNEIRKVNATGSAWWTNAPTIAYYCLQACIMPLKIMEAVANLAVSMLFLSIFGVAALWYFGFIPDKVVSDALISAGNRILSIIESAGLLK